MSKLVYILVTLLSVAAYAPGAFADENTGPKNEPGVGACPCHQPKPIDKKTEERLTQVNDATQAQPNALKLPELLTATDKRKLYTMKDVCKDSLKKDPTKKAALVVVKTHYCDEGTQVCVKSLMNISDKANYFIQKNFTTYHTRFWRNTRQFETGEKTIRDEWGKQDVNPEAYVIDVQKCELVYRDYAMNHEGVFSNDPMTSYFAWRKFLLSSDKVRNLLGLPASDDDKQLEFEKKQVEALLKKYPHQNKQTVIELADQQGRDLGLYSDGPETLHRLPNW
jgi:hypothetical protein